MGGRRWRIEGPLRDERIDDGTTSELKVSWWAVDWWVRVCLGRGGGECLKGRGWGEGVEGSGREWEGSGKGVGRAWEEGEWVALGEGSGRLRNLGGWEGEKQEEEGWKVEGGRMAEGMAG